MVFTGVATLKLSAAFIARDSLALSTIQLIMPIEALNYWQQAINPNLTAAQ